MQIQQPFFFHTHPSTLGQMEERQGVTRWTTWTQDSYVLSFILDLEYFVEQFHLYSTVSTVFLDIFVWGISPLNNLSIFI